MAAANCRFNVFSRAAAAASALSRAAFALVEASASLRALSSAALALTSACCVWSCNCRMRSFCFPNSLATASARPAALSARARASSNDTFS